MNMTFEQWYDILRDLARQYRENVNDSDAWRQCFEDGQSPEAAFFDEYPEHES